MVCHDVAGTVRQEQIVQYIQHIYPAHTTNWGRSWEGGLPLKKLLGPLPHNLHAPIPLCIEHTIQLHVKNTSVRIQIVEKEGCIVGQ